MSNSNEVRRLLSVRPAWGPASQTAEWQDCSLKTAEMRKRGRQNEFTSRSLSLSYSIRLICICPNFTSAKCVISKEAFLKKKKNIFQNQILTPWDDNEADKTFTSKVVNVRKISNQVCWLFLVAWSFFFQVSQYGPKVVTNGWLTVYSLTCPTLLYY